MYKRTFLASFMITVTIFFSVICIRCYVKGTFGNPKFYESIEESIENSLPGRRFLREIYGASNFLLSPNEKVASDGSAFVKDEDGFLQGVNYIAYGTNEAVNHISSLDDFCKKNHIDFAYISYPSKVDSSRTEQKYGIETNEEETREKFLEGLKANDIHVLDIRKLLEDDGYNYKDVFYKTDHHWKSQFGLYGARAIANYLNKEFGYNIDADLLSEQEFNFINHEKIWFGETGRSMSITWVRALDDFMEITPSYKTSFTGDDFSNPEKLKENGDFSILYNPSGYAGNNDLYSYSAHYSYGKYAGYGAHIHNNLIKNGKKIMIVKDSFSVVVIPFLACAASDVFVWDMRDTDDSIYDYISKNKIDAVIVAYTDFWKSKMYDFQ